LLAFAFVTVITAIALWQIIAVAREWSWSDIEDFLHTAGLTLGCVCVFLSTTIYGSGFPLAYVLLSGSIAFAIFIASFWVKLKYARRKLRNAN